MSSSSQKRQMLQPWPLFLMFSNSRDRSILPQQHQSSYARVPKSISASLKKSSSIISDCASNSTLITNASPFHSQTGLSTTGETDKDKHVKGRKKKIEEENIEITDNGGNNGRLKKSPQLTTPVDVHYYDENLLTNENLKRHTGGEEDSESSAYEQLNPLLSKIIINNNKKNHRRLHRREIESPKMFHSQEFQVKMNAGPPFKTYFQNDGLATAPKQRFPRYYNQILAALSLSLGSLVVGFSNSYTSPALPTMKKEPWLGITEQAGSWIGSIMPLSALFGGIAGGPFIECVGRRNTILATGLPFVAAWLLIVFAANIYMILAGRMLSGFCVGVASLVLPVYLGETLQPEVRGTLGLLPTSFGNIGILLCSVVGKYLNWYQLAMVGACLPVPFMTLMFLIPETPRWYVAKNLKENARESLQWLRGKKSDISEELSSIEKAHFESEQNSSSHGALKELFKKSYKKSLLISLGLMGFQQFSGINAVIFYSVEIFQDAGSTININDCAIIVGVVNFLSTFMATVLIDRLGRKILLYISSISMMLTAFSLGTFFYGKNLKYDVDSFGWIPLASFVIYVIGFSLGFGPIPWLMMGEILPAKIRGSAASVVTAFNWSCVFIVTKTYTDAVNAVGLHGTFWLFGFITFIGLIFVILFVPETRGKSLEEIESKLTGRTVKKINVDDDDGEKARSTAPISC